MGSINKTNILEHDKSKLSNLQWIDRISFTFGKMLTSTLLIIIVMLTFLIGVAVHLKDVFDSWFLAIGMQAVVLIASVNSDILPTIKLSETKTLTLIPLIMSILMCWYLFISFDGVETELYSTAFWTAMSKATGLAATEYMFSYLFTFRFNKFINDFKELDNIIAKQQTLETQSRLNQEIADKHATKQQSNQRQIVSNGSNLNKLF